MKLAFLISAHTDAEHLNRLIKSLPQTAHFFVHIDSKSDIRPFTSMIAQENIHFLTHRVNVVWGSINEVEYQVELLRAALSTDQFDYMISMSGLDYPIMGNKEMMQFFEEAQGRIFLQGIAMDQQGEAAQLYRQLRPLSSMPWKNGSLGSKLKVALRESLSKLGVQKTLVIHCPRKHYRLYKGAAWWAITPDLAGAVVGEWDHNEHLKGYFKTSFCPAETFFQTVAFNSEYASRCMLSTGKYTTLSALTPLTYIHYHPVIKVLDETDYDTLLQSGKLFCRKTVSGTSDILLDKLDAYRKDR